MKQIHNYNDFLSELNRCGFCMDSGNSDGIFSIVTWGWQEEPPYETKVEWHTGDKMTDPWEWHTMVYDEKPKIAFAKLFFNKSGYITKEWYPYFLVARRQNLTFEEEYFAGKIGQWEKQIYECIAQNGKIAYHNIKAIVGCDAEDKSKFERAVTVLQTKMFITGCGKEQKISTKTNEPYGWPSTVFCTTEEFFDEDVFETASKISRDEAIEKITEQILKINPEADKKKIAKFIKG